ncbi:AbrB family transcriptional regulator [Pelotomaculum propionicicum]|uniref:AbrB family transcriptional regulator n=1 Tax=Pelotomaculum propionicicum TaxID=258475 RepID=UPI003B7E8CF2
MILRFLETLIVSLVGGLLFRLSHLPLPWLLGSLTAVMVWSLAVKRDTFWPVEFRNSGLIILGFMLGASFTTGTLQQIIRQLPAMVFATSSTIIFSLVVGYIVSRRTGISLASGIIGSVPGGLTQMVVLSEEIGDTDLTVVTFMQTIRLLSTVFIVPFIVIHGMAAAGGQDAAVVTSAINNSILQTPWNALLYTVIVLIAAWAAVKISLPTPFLLGPLIGAAALALAGFQAPSTPSFLVVISQLFIGAYLGLSIQPASLENWKKLLPYTLMGSIAVVFFSLGVGFMLTRMHSLGLTSAFLGTSPGGMGEMGLTAVLVGANVSLVTAYQMFRLLFILFVMPLVLKRFFGSAGTERKSV